MKLTDKQLKRFTEKFEIKAKSIIIMDKGKKITISDCNRNNELGDFCPGEFQISKDPYKKLCKHFSDPFNI